MLKDHEHVHCVRRQTRRPVSNNKFGIAVCSLNNVGCR